MRKINKNMYVGEYKGVDLWLDKSSMRFVAEPEEGQTISTDSHQKLEDLIDLFFGDPDNRPKKPIRLMKIGRGIWPDLKRAVVTCIHKGTGHPVIKCEKERALQESSRTGYYVPMTRLEISEYYHLRDKAKAAFEESEEFLKRFEVRNLKQHIKECWSEEFVKEPA